MKLRSLFVLIMAGVLFASCAPRGVIAERPMPTEGDTYLLDTGDKLRITVFGQADLSGEYAVDGTGAMRAASRRMNSRRRLRRSSAKSSCAIRTSAFR